VKKIIISPGEIDSVGLEVTLKALWQIQNRDLYKDSVFIFFSNLSLLQEHLEKLGLEDLQIGQCKSLQEELTPGFYWVESQGSAFSWFENAVDFCIQKPEDTALVTGPLKKSSFEKSKSLGHTDYLRKKFDSPVFMTFFGKAYNVLLLSDHIPIDQVSNINFKLLLNQAFGVLNKIPKTKKVALLGVNPHAGEDGLLGSIEENAHKVFVSKNRDHVEGPLPADSFFSIDSYKKYSFLIANYHDQALIPFKLIHGFDGAQASLGLPIVRTSVNHGTGDDLYLKNKANANSMIQAVALAFQLLNAKMGC